MIAGGMARTNATLVHVADFFPVTAAVRVPSENMPGYEADTEPDISGKTYPALGSGAGYIVFQIAAEDQSLRANPR